MGSIKRGTRLAIELFKTFDPQRLLKSFLSLQVSILSDTSLK